MSASESQRLKEFYEFGPFRVDPEKEVLLRAGQPVQLTPKTFQILLVLIRHHKEVVTKDDLMKTVWPDTFVEEANLSRNIFMLRKALGETPQDHQYVLTVPGRGYRFAETVRLVPGQQVNIVTAQHSKVQVQVLETEPWGWIAVLAMVLVAVAVAAFQRFVMPPSVLTGKDTVVLADFANSTGDPVFDDTLRQGLAVELQQSPFLEILSDERVQQTLRLMGCRRMRGSPGKSRGKSASEPEAQRFSRARLPPSAARMCSACKRRTAIREASWTGNRHRRRGARMYSIR
jgi:eukaryotic-like serine/threonine-protein kinase